MHPAEGLIATHSMLSDASLHTAFPGESLGGFQRVTSPVPGAPVQPFLAGSDIPRLCRRPHGRTLIRSMKHTLLLTGVLLQAALLIPAQTASATDDLARGQQVYLQVCFACHQPTGLGLPGMFPPLAGSDWVSAPKPDRLIRMVLHGLTGPIKVNGQAFTTPAPIMPPQGALLGDAQIADVLSYVRHNFGNGASRVTPDQVKSVREAEKARTAMWTEAELEKIPAN